MRKIYMAGMSHKVAEIAIREKFYIPMDVKIDALKNSPFNELLILATCNRTEIYVASDYEIKKGELVRYVCSLAHQNFETFAKFFYEKEGEDVIKHIMNVCAGLDSVAMGEDQILHQISRAYETAHQMKATKNCLNKLFQSAIHTTKRIKTETNLSKLSCNIPFLAMKQMQQTFDDLENRNVYIIGLGEMGSLMLKYVQENTTKIFASSKTFANAQKYADVLTPIPFENRYDVFGTCDIIILCSACQEPIVTKNEFEKSIKNFDVNKKRLIIDLGNPRNAEACIGNVQNINYVCVDDLEKIVSENRKLRLVEFESAKKILSEGLEEFLQWFNMDEVSKQVHSIAQSIICEANIESKKLLRSMPNLLENDSERISMMFERFAKKMANDFLYKVKENNAPKDVLKFLEYLNFSEKIDE